MATVILGLTSALTWGAADFGGGMLARRTPLFSVVFFSQLVGAAVAFGLTIVRGETAPQTTDLVWSLLGGLTGGIGIAALYQALAGGRMGVVAPRGSASPSSRVCPSARSASSSPRSARATPSVR